MNLKNNITTILALLTVFSVPTSVHSQDLNLIYSNGNVTLPLDQSSSMTVDPSNGNINITTTNSAEVIGENLGLECTGETPVVSLSNSSGGSTTLATVFHTIANNDAVYCKKTNAWSGTLLGNPFVTNGSTNVSQNGVYSLSCTNAFGTSNTVSTTVSNIVTVLAPSLSLSASPATVSAGSNSTITYTIGNSPTSCTKSGDWPAASTINTANGTHTQNITNITTNQTFGLTCQNSAGNVTRNTSVTVDGLWSAGSTNPAPWVGEASCTGARAPILSSNEDRSILTRTSGVYNGTFAQFQGAGTGTSFVGEPFPGQISESIELRLDRNQYIAARFITSSTVTNNNITAKFSFETPASASGPIPNGLTATISKCPGDFSTEPLAGQTRCKAIGASSSLFWSDKTNPAPSGFYCELEPDTEYYLNIVHSQSPPNYTSSTCEVSSCGILATLQMNVTR